MEPLAPTRGCPDPGGRWPPGSDTLKESPPRPLRLDSRRTDEEMKEDE